MRSLLIGAVMLGIAITIVHAQQKPPVPMTKYTDAEDGVSLQYPSVWKRVSAPEAYCPSMEFSDGSRAKIPVHLAVEFTAKGNYYEKTVLEAMVFLFGTRKNITEDACEQIAKNFPQDDPPAAFPDNAPARFDYGRGGECGLNHAIDAQVFTRFSGERCYIFEEDFDYYLGAPEGRRKLTPTEGQALLKHLDGIMDSVQIEATTLPKSWATTTYQDAANGVSFQYPAAFHETKDVSDYFPPALLEMKGITFHAKLAYSPTLELANSSQDQEASTDLGELAFLFATKHTPSAGTCYALIKDWDNADSGAPAPKSVTFSGVTFHTAEVSDSGLSHFIEGKIYATYRTGTCFLFEQIVTGLDGYAGDVTDAQMKQIDAHMDAIAPTIRFTDATK